MIRLSRHHRKLPFSRFYAVDSRGSAASSKMEAARKGFGSFHSGDIEELVRNPGLDLSDTTDVLEAIESDVLSRIICFPEFGAASQQTPLYGLDHNNFTFLNHGAFGAVLVPLQHASNLWRVYCEKQPLRFIDRELFPLIAHTLQRMAAFLHCPAAELYPLQNVTTGLNTVFQSFQLDASDEVICLSLTYGSTKKMITDLCDRSGAKMTVVPLPLPICSEEVILKEFESALLQSSRAINKDNSKGNRIVVLDHVTSNTAMVLPVLQMAQLARAQGAFVIVDAAHSLMSQPNIRIYPTATTTTTTTAYANTATSNANDYNKSTGNHETPSTSGGGSSCTSSAQVNATEEASLAISDVVDVWLTNGHKWFSAPKGVAFMWVHPAVSKHLRPVIVSHGFQGYQGYDVHDSHGSSSSSSSHFKWWHQSTYNRGSSNTYNYNYTHSSSSLTGGEHNQHLYSNGRLLSGLVWDGCRDYAPLLTVPTALTLWSQIGMRNGKDCGNNVDNACSSSSSTGSTGNATAACTTTTATTDAGAGAGVNSTELGMAICREYMMNLLHQQVLPMLMEVWELEESDLPAPPSMRKTSPMLLVPLPKRFSKSSCTDSDAFRLQEHLYHKHRLEVPIKCLEGRLYVRISAHIYNTIDQYEKLAHIICDI
mmetsp:Transcript_28234/g.47479  ORF Transcript_28234/g.47479 Transcript_28234/m.47479 type:complete len:652 (+) Transcript_28234:33-1988(+)